MLWLCCAVADSRYRGRGQPNDVSASSASNVSKPSPDPAGSAVAGGGQPSRSGPPAKQSADPARIRNGPVGKTTASGRIQNGQ